MPSSEIGHIRNAEQLENSGSLLWMSRTNKEDARTYLNASIGVQALKLGGTLVYSTSSLAERENDGAVRQAVDTLGGLAENLSEPVSEGIDANLLKQWGAEKTSCGWAFLPDASFQGPTYFSLLRKRE